MKNTVQFSLMELGLEQFSVYICLWKNYFFLDLPSVQSLEQDCGLPINKLNYTSQIPFYTVTCSLYSTS